MGFVAVMCFIYAISTHNFWHGFAAACLGVLAMTLGKALDHDR